MQFCNHSIQGRQQDFISEGAQPAQNHFGGGTPLIFCRRQHEAAKHQREISHFGGSTCPLCHPPPQIRHCEQPRVSESTGGGR